ncbi:helix-turn-helix transcriptional regulator [Pseudovibrio brasiliensis]|uniref:DNA-binding protein n=1 Tax=Pseudovibrio brasiliensis TaxID=1898042 RepID=A0ABX8AK04_9HYPH|nr:hypothetical protein [Pseudovibrio brasiliensis]QUS55384.1 DNA-binding protein [Pseudovibrio brasiliensis]
MAEQVTFLTASGVRARYQIGNTTLWRWSNGAANNNFPAPIKMGNRKRWRLADLEAWEQSLEAANDSDQQVAVA